MTASNRARRFMWWAHVTSCTCKTIETEGLTWGKAASKHRWWCPARYTCKLFSWWFWAAITLRREYMRRRYETISISILYGDDAHWDAIRFPLPNDATIFEMRWEGIKIGDVPIVHPEAEYHLFRVVATDAANNIAYFTPLTGTARIRYLNKLERDAANGRPRT